MGGVSWGFTLVQACVPRRWRRELVEEAAEKSAAEESKRRKALSGARKDVKGALAEARERDVQRLLTQCALSPQANPMTQSSWAPTIIGCRKDFYTVGFIA